MRISTRWDRLSKRVVSKPKWDRTTRAKLVIFIHVFLNENTVHICELSVAIYIRTVHISKLSVVACLPKTVLKSWQRSLSFGTTTTSSGQPCDIRLERSSSPRERTDLKKDQVPFICSAFVCIFY